MDVILPRVLPVRFRNQSLNTEKVVTKGGLFISVVIFSLSLFLANGIYLFCCLLTIILMVYHNGVLANREYWFLLFYTNGYRL
jgi:hypothetical protein